MPIPKEYWENKIYNINNENDFNACAIEAFQFQYEQIEVYRQYCFGLNIQPNKINHYQQIPFLPIGFFKTHQVIDKTQNAETVFTSSGTTGTITSRHEVAQLKIYESSFTKAFEQFYGSVQDYCILALLPSYLERGGSSLVYMADHLIKASKHQKSGFYLNNYQSLHQTLKTLISQKQKIILLGVTYALLDLAEQFPLDLANTIIMETGGMKGKRKELIREELHGILCRSFRVDKIHSEYGMTELLSQGYSFGDGIFKAPQWMKILIRDSYDPFHFLDNQITGGINVIDLANIYSCCFIETKDLGKTFNDGSFTILGRFDQSDIRGCNLMVE